MSESNLREEGSYHDQQQASFASSFNRIPQIGKQNSDQKRRNQGSNPEIQSQRRNPSQQKFDQSEKTQNSKQHFRMPSSARIAIHGEYLEKLALKNRQQVEKLNPYQGSYLETLAQNAANKQSQQNKSKSQNSNLRIFQNSSPQNQSSSHMQNSVGGGTRSNQGAFQQISQQIDKSSLNGQQQQIGRLQKRNQTGNIQNEQHRAIEGTSMNSNNGAIGARYNNAGSSNNNTNISGAAPQLKANLRMDINSLVSPKEINKYMQQSQNNEEAGGVPAKFGDDGDPSHFDISHETF